MIAEKHKLILPFLVTNKKDFAHLHELQLLPAAVGTDMTKGL